MKVHVADRVEDVYKRQAIIAAQVAAATIYDMCKAVQKDMVIRDVRLVHKSGGRTGTFERRESSGERT